MMINFSEEEIRSFLANVQISVEGERSMLQKLTSFLYAAERKIAADFLPMGMMPVFEDALKPVVAYQAIYDALPSLDVVLTPNGLATVGNNTLAPASSARSLALRQSMATLLFREQDALLVELRKSEEWRGTMHGAEFRESLFPVMSRLCEIWEESQAPSFELYHILAIKAHAIEDRIGRNYISPELLQHLREAVQSDSLTEPEKKVVADVRVAVRAEIRSKGRSGCMLTHTVEFIRQHEEDFPLWFSSPTAFMFLQPPVFVNKKRSGGYFF